MKVTQVRSSKLYITILLCCVLVQCDECVPHTYCMLCNTTIGSFSSYGANAAVDVGRLCGKGRCHCTDFTQNQRFWRVFCYTSILCNFVYTNLLNIHNFPIFAKSQSLNLRPWSHWARGRPEEALHMDMMRISESFPYIFMIPNARLLIPCISVAVGRWYIQDTQH